MAGPVVRTDEGIARRAIGSAVEGRSAKGFSAVSAETAASVAYACLLSPPSRYDHAECSVAALRSGGSIAATRRCRSTSGAMQVQLSPDVWQVILRDHDV